MSKTSDEELQIHQRLLEGDETATADLFRVLLTPTIVALKKIFPEPAKKDESLIWDAVTDAFFEYISRPETFDPARKSLRSYLRMSAIGDLKNRIERDSRRTSREESFDKLVELGGELRNMEMEASSNPEAPLLADELFDWIRKILPYAKDQEVFELMVEGTRDTKSYAIVLGITDLPPDKQKAEVKRTKDRIKVRLKRMLGTHTAARTEGSLDHE